MHTFGIKIYLNNLEQTAKVIRWITKSLQNLPAVHPLRQIVFDVWCPPEFRPAFIQEWSTLDESMSVAGHPVTSVFKLHRSSYGQDDARWLESEITSVFPLSTKLGLVSFAWTDQRSNA